MKNKTIAAVFAAALILMCFVPLFFFPGRHDSERYEILCFGDSLVAGTYGGGAVPDYIEKGTGRRALNAGFGGTTMSVTDEVAPDGDKLYLFTMTELSKALLQKDFSLQVMSTTSKYITDYSQGRHDVALQLNDMVYDSIRYVIIEQGINDYMSGKKLDDEADRYNTHTFAGALRTSIENVQKALPDATLVLVTPTYMWANGMDFDCTETDFGGGTLLDYIAKEKEVAGEYNLTCVDNFHGSGINKENYRNYLYDGLHAHEGGNTLIADNIIRNIEGICK